MIAFFSRESEPLMFLSDTFLAESKAHLKKENILLWFSAQLQAIKSV